MGHWSNTGMLHHVWVMTFSPSWITDDDNNNPSCIFKHVVFYSLINSTELNIQHPLQNKNRFLSRVCQREKQYLHWKDCEIIQTRMSKLIQWFSLACTSCTLKTDFVVWCVELLSDVRPVGLSLKCRMKSWWVFVAKCFFYSSKASHSRTYLSLSDCTLHCPQCICETVRSVSFLVRFGLLVGLVSREGVIIQLPVVCCYAVQLI